MNAGMMIPVRVRLGAVVVVCAVAACMWVALTGPVVVVTFPGPGMLGVILGSLIGIVLIVPSSKIFGRVLNDPHGELKPTIALTLITVMSASILTVMLIPNVYFIPEVVLA